MVIEKMPTPPSALSQWDRVEAQIGGRRTVLFLDYDGTLTPIVDRPELAHLTDNMRATLREVASSCPTIIVSGRGREDVAQLIGLDDLIYAGSHGFDISGPGASIRNEIGADLLPMLQEAAAHFATRTRGIEGVLVENKRFSVAVHYRLVREDLIPTVEAMVDELVNRVPQLTKTHGEKVFEVRPAMEWDKGSAVLWLLDALGLDGPDLVPIYVGDDTTDEDAFAALERRGLGILVSEMPRSTRAAYVVKNPDEVHDLLSKIAGLPQNRRDDESASGALR